ncbi:MAG TPA: LuxR C-terminal-related transcriptional regulator [Trebonia sp.]|nr:LuxR C-terminal-related transcriptional regulator [Trebonia sp.]
MTAVERAAVADALGARYGFPAELTAFVGRAGAVAEVADRLTGYRLVTLTGPGGAGKTRLAGQVAEQTAARFADGVWLAELATVTDPAQVAATVAAALGIRDLPAEAAAEALARALSRRQLLLVLDNCEHVIGAAAELCARLLLAADDVRLLATSREPLRIAGEARYRLGPLALPPSGDPAAAAECEAVTLFADRARRADPGFALDADTLPSVARLVTRLDGLPLAIELAAARVDVLGVAQLLDRINDRFSLLADADRLAEDRQRSLAAAVRWSYQLLDATEQRVFRALAAFPGPFTLDAAEAVTNAEASRVVLRLVDCSLVLPPRTGPDGRSRYAMLETLRAYAAGLLAEAGEEAEVSATLTAYAAEMSLEAAVEIHTRGREVAGLRRLDAEDVTVHHALAWALDHDPAAALRLTLTLAPWWQLRGRLPSQAPLLAAAAEHAEAGTDAWCKLRLLLGQVAGEAEDPPAMLAQYTAVRDALEDRRGPAAPWEQAMISTCLAARAAALLRVDRVAEAVEDGRRSVCLAREAGGGAIEAMALGSLSMAISQDGDGDGALRLARQAQRIAEGHAGVLRRGLGYIVTGILIEAGDLAAAERACTATLASCREVGDQINLCGMLTHATILDLRTGRTDAAAAHLRELLHVATQTGRRSLVHLGLDCCGHLCAATGRPGDAVTAWAAMSALAGPWPPLLGGLNPARRDMLRRRAADLLGQPAAQAAEERGAAMSLATATEYALLLAAGPQPPAGERAAADEMTGLGRLSPRERELVSLVARGRTDAQIAAELFITVRTVGTHLDRIRDKTGCRRRADLTRLALSAGLV